MDIKKIEVEMYELENGERFEDVVEARKRAKYLELVLLMDNTDLCVFRTNQSSTTCAEWILEHREEVLEILLSDSTS